MGTSTATIQEPPVLVQNAALDQSPPQGRAAISNLQSLVCLDHVNVALNGTRVLHDVCWELKRGENWAVLGSNGAGKSTLLRLLRGEIWPAPVDGGKRVYHFDKKPTESPIGMKQRMAIVSAEQQQRYTRVHGRKYGDDFGHFITVRDIVFTGLLDSELVTRKPKPAELAKVAQTLQQVGIADLSNVPFDKLSQGQLRKALIARAVIGKPDVLILDEVGVGLDAHSRRNLLDMIQRVAEQGTQILMTTHRRDELIPAITHAMELKHGHIVSAKPLLRDGQSAISNNAHEWREFDGSSNGHTTTPFLINITNADVALDEGAKVVLHNVTWRMNEGEHWMLLGDNGVGKTTLLKLILGDLWPAHGGSIERFNHRGTRNVWDIKKRIGYVSADLQTRYYADLTTEQVISTGYSASVGWLSRTTKAQDKRVQDMVDLFGLRPLAKRSILEMSYGQARKVLVARALVNEPKLVVLDEVFDGLDVHFRAELTSILQSIAAHTGIILVSHHEADVLQCITHRAIIRDGRIVRQELRLR